MKKNLQLAILLATTLFISCTSNKKKEAVQDQKPRVKIALVQSRPVQQIEEYTATVEAEVKNNISPASPVRIDDILVEVGDHVKKGQKLVLMDESGLEQMKLQLDNQEKEFNRMDELYKVGGVSKSEWDAAKTALDVKRTAYNNLCENTSLLSPINGIITARNYDDGDMCSLATPILTVEQIKPVKLFINVSESYYNKLSAKDPVKVKLDVYDDKEFDGYINIVYPTIDPTTRTFTVEVKMKNNKELVRPGMFARVVVDFGTEDNVVVPDRAIIKQVGAGDRYVYVYKDGKVTYNKVELGQRLGAEYELKSGVPNNSQVIIAGQSRLINGAEVEVEK